jgi:hypothetical protein
MIRYLGNRIAKQEMAIEMGKRGAAFGEATVWPTIIRRSRKMGRFFRILGTDLLVDIFDYSEGDCGDITVIG